ncbi:MAG: hypothetical protein HYX66_01340 [Ignavibacteria bacterium]|nr:hypothetical protein [Ignavibacteria bacterium]
MNIKCVTVRASVLNLLCIAVIASACNYQKQEDSQTLNVINYCDTISFTYCYIGNQWEYISASRIKAVASDIKAIYIDGFGGKYFEHELLNAMVSLEEVRIGSVPMIGNRVNVCMDSNTIADIFYALSKQPKLATLEIHGVVVPSGILQYVKRLRHLTTLTIQTLFVDAGSGFDVDSTLRFLSFSALCDWKRLHFERLHAIEELHIDLLSDSAEVVLKQIALVNKLKNIRLGIGGRKDTTTKIALPSSYYSMHLESFEIYAPDLYFDIDIKKMSSIMTLKSLCIRTRTSEENKSYSRHVRRLMRNRPDVLVEINNCNPWM